MLPTILLLITFALTAAAQRAPQVEIPILQVSDGDSFDVKGTGFTPRRAVISHLLKPNQTEYPVLQLYTDDRGGFTHTIDTLLLLPGTHELWVVDEATGITSNRVQFTVGFGGASPATSEVLSMIERHAGVWRGTAPRNIPPSPSSVLVSLTGKPGNIAGTIVYPDLGCGGILGYRTISKDSIEFAETLTFGAERCAGNGHATVRLAADGSLTFDWKHAGLAGPARGNLTLMKE